MLKKLLVFGTALAIFSATATAQIVDEKKMAALKTENDKDGDGWKTGGSIGLDLSQLLLINPKVGGGDNRIGGGGAIGLFANKKTGKFLWNSAATMQLAAQRIGDKTAAFQKNIDILRLTTEAGILSKNPKLYYGAIASFESQLLRTYKDNFIKSDVKTDLLSKFLAPARIKAGLGIGYKPSPKLSFFFAPLSVQYIYVGDDALAKDFKIYGNDEGKNSSTQGGAQLIGRYNDKFMEDKIVFGSSLELFSAYTNNFGRIDVLWHNDLGVKLFKNITLSIFTDTFYDDDTQVVVKRGIAANGTAAAVKPVLGLKPSFAQGLLIKYGRTF
jgi:hypothetical protein